MLKLLIEMMHADSELCLGCVVFLCFARAAENELFIEELGCGSKHDFVSADTGL